MPEDLLQILQVELRCDPKNTPRAKYAVAAKDVQMRMKAVISLMTVAQRPLKTGFRFSRKARGPSFPSSDINIGMP